jgi:hypothetical protein
MIRRFNYTSRRRLPLERIAVELRPGPDAASFDARIDLGDLDLPSEAKVFVEAYYKASYQRFDFGKVAAVSAPASRLLNEIDRGTTVLFRVKVVDATDSLGRIVAELDDIGGKDSQAGEAGRECILPVNFRDLGQEMWRLNLEDTSPVLEVSRFPGAEAFVKNDPLFRGLVLPEAVRQILQSIVSNDEWEGVEEAGGWQGNWIRFIGSYTNEPPPAAGSEARSREDWIDHAVRSFCERLQFREHIVALREKERET